MAKTKETKTKEKKSTKSTKSTKTTKTSKTKKTTVKAQKEKKPAKPVKPVKETKEPKRQTATASGKFELVGKVYDKVDSPLGEIHICDKTKSFRFISKDGKTKIDAKTLPELTDREMRGKVNWLYIRYKRTKSFNIMKHYKPAKEKKLCWKSEEFYG